MSARIIVFIDAQNTYKGAREAFFKEDDFHTKGNYRPHALGQLLVSKSAPGSLASDRALKEVRVYTGQPTQRDPRGFGPARRRHAIWRRDGANVISRPLMYPRGYPKEKPKEKGIDVSLAIDVIVLALRNEYDTAIVVSTDTDILPAIEAVRDLTDKKVEIATWRGHAPLGKPSKDLWCHVLSLEDYDSVADDMDYNVIK